MKRFFLAAVLASAAMASAAKPKWHELSRKYTFEKFAADFGKSYDADELPQRKARFTSELNRVLAHNAQQPAPMYRMGINKFSDWSDEEKNRLRGAKVSEKLPAGTAVHKVRSDGGALPYSVDYRIHEPRVLTAVKDQGQCGSCWAHSTTETIESYYAMATNQLYELSQQQVTSCTPSPFGGGACDGNSPFLALQYAASTPVQEEWTNPYQSYWGFSPTCPANPSAGVQLGGYSMVNENDAGAFMDALATTGPLAVVVYAATWPSYESGVFNNCPFNSQFALDHAVQAIGYGHDTTLNVDYWIIRNSWSADWGESGFIRLLRQPVGQTACSNVTGSPTCGTCGVLTQAIYPTLPTWVA